MRNTIVITCDGGMVQAVDTNFNDMEVIVVDRDIECFDYDEDELVRINGEPVNAYIMPTTNNETWINDVREALKDE